MISMLLLAAIFITIFMILFLHPTVGNEEKRLRVRFANLDKVSVGTRVTFAGKPVGEVYSIKEIPDAVDNRISHDGVVYVYELVLRVDSLVNVFNTDDIFIVTSGLLGEKSINITPKPPKEGEKPLIINDQIIYALPSGSLEEAVRQVSGLSDVVKETLVEVLDLLKESKKQAIVPKLGEALGNIRDISKAIDPDQVTSIVDNASTLFERVVKSWDTIDDSLKNVKNITTNSDKIVGLVAKGEGTAGRILMKDDFYLKFNALLNKADILLNDINHYGLLFNSDKGWQRLRARRINLMQRLRSPQEFRNYFNDEVDQISTSLARVSMVLDMTEDDINCCELLENKEFTKVFAELLRKINSLDEEIRSYHIQIFEDCSVPKTELVE